MVAQATAVQFLAQRLKIEAGACIQLKRLPHQWSHYGIDGFRFAATLVHISDGGPQRVEPLLQAAMKAFAGFFPEIPDEVGGDHCLNVGGEAPTPRMEIKTLVDEMDFAALVGKFTDGGPILEIARTTVQLVEDDPLGFSAAEKLESLVEYGASLLGGGFCFLKPSGDVKVIALGIAQNRVALLLKRHPCCSLFDGGNACVSDIFLHGGSYLTR